MTDTPMEEMDREQREREAESDDLLEGQEGEDEGEREEPLPDEE